MPETLTHATTGRTGGIETARSELLNVHQVAAMIGCSPRHVVRLSDAGRMPESVKLGALVRWSRRDIEGWIDAGCPSTGACRTGGNQ